MIDAIFHLYLSISTQVDLPPTRSPSSSAPFYQQPCKVVRHRDHSWPSQDSWLNGELEVCLVPVPNSRHSPHQFSFLHNMTLNSHHGIVINFLASLLNITAIKGIYKVFNAKVTLSDSFKSSVRKVRRC